MFLNVIIQVRLMTMCYNNFGDDCTVIYFPCRDLRKSRKQ